MKVRDVMTQPAISCRNDTDIGTAARVMLEKQIGTLPVIDEHQLVVGMLTDRDIAMAAAFRQRTAAHIAVHEAMTQAVRLCGADDDLDGALKQMAATRVRRLPVVDAKGRLTGILAVDDIIQRALDQPGGIPAADFVKTMIRISEQPSVEPEFDYTETFVSG